MTLRSKYDAKLIIMAFVMLIPASLYSQKKWLKNKFPAESARWVWISYLNPALQGPARSTAHLGYGIRYGANIFYYSPTLRWAPASKLEYGQNNYTRFDSKLTRFISDEANITLYFNRKFGKLNYLYNVHKGINIGISSSWALSRNKFYVDGKDLKLNAKEDIRLFRLYGYLGMNWIKDIFHGYPNESGLSPKVGIHTFDFSFRIPLYELGNYFILTKGSNRTLFVEPTLSIGQTLDVKHNANNYNIQPVKKTSFVQMPSYWEPSRRRLYSGLFWETSIQKSIDSIGVNLEGENVQNTGFRSTTTNTIGFSIHLGNYENKLTEGGLLESKPFRVGIFASSAVSFRRLQRVGDTPNLKVYNFNTLDLFGGLRFEPIKGIFISGGIWGAMPFGQKGFTADGNNLEKSFAPTKLRFAWFAGISWRHWVYLRLKPSVILPLIYNTGPSKWIQRHEISLGIGF